MKLRILIFIACMFLTSCEYEDSFSSNLQRSDVYVQLYSESKYDFLWVFDNSASMSSIRQYVTDNMQNFITILNSRKAIDFQMAVTNTDQIGTGGNLIASAGGLTVVKSATSSNAASDFASIVSNITDSGSAFWEQGLESSYQAITNSGSLFSRNGVPLIVIFISDENDYSCQSNCFGGAPERNADWEQYPVSRYVDLFTQYKSAQGSELSIFPIVGLSTSSCSVSSLGNRYVEVQEKVAGLGTSGSVCPSDLADAYKKIAQVIADRGAVFPLSTPSAGRGMKVYVDGVLIPFDPANYEFDADKNAIVFTGAIPKKGAVIEVSYDQKVN